MEGVPTVSSLVVRSPLPADASRTEGCALGALGPAGLAPTAGPVPPSDRGGAPERFGVSEDWVRFDSFCSFCCSSGMELASMVRSEAGSEPEPGPVVEIEADPAWRSAVGVGAQTGPELDGGRSPALASEPGSEPGSEPESVAASDAWPASAEETSEASTAAEGWRTPSTVASAAAAALGVPVVASVVPAAASAAAASVVIGARASGSAAASEWDASSVSLSPIATLPSEVGRAALTRAFDAAGPLGELDAAALRVDSPEPTDPAGSAPPTGAGDPADGAAGGAPGDDPERGVTRTRAGVPM